MMPAHINSSSWTIHVERFVEPYTGMPLLGVGGDGPESAAADFRIEIRTDGRPATSVTPVRVEQVDGIDRLTFGTQFPFDPGMNRVQVIAVIGGVESTLLDQTAAEITRREAVIGPASPPASALKRCLQSVTSGEIVSYWRWKARLGRFAGLALRGRQKVRNKLLARRFRPRSPHDTYVDNTAVTPRLRAAMLAEAKRFRHRPTVSILLPVYNSDPRWLAEAIDSVRGQVYDRWELCIADDASTDSAHLRFLDRLERDPDRRIKLVRRRENGHICVTTNSAAELATGEFIALLDHDDKLSPHVLFEIVRDCQNHPDTDLVYTDEDKIDEAGRRFDPQFKPDWSPDLLLSYNYVNHFTCIRRTVFERAGRFRTGYHGSQDHDLLLRVTELTDRVRHIPQILYHWRSHPQSTASSAGQKNYVHTAGRTAVEDALRRRGQNDSLHVPPFADRLGLPVLGRDGPDDGPAVAVIVHGDPTAAARTVRAVRQTTAYRNITPYLVADTAEIADALNRIAASRTEDYLLFLAAGVEPTDRRWLSRLLVHLESPGVGAVGGLIRDEDGSILSAGTVLGMRDGIAPGNAAAGVPADAVCYYFYAEVARTVSAPGAGCLLTSRAAFDRAGGFDADRFGRTLYDVDYALRLAGQGLRTVHVGGAEFRWPNGPADRHDDPVELRTFRLAHGRPTDPYYNPNLSDRDSFRPLTDGPLSVPAEASSPPVRTLVAAHNLNTPEGAPRYLSEIVLGLTGRGRIVPAIVSPLGGAGETVYLDESIPVEVADAPWSRRFVDGFWTPHEYESAQKYLTRLMRKRRPEVVLANTLLTFPVVEAAARLGIPAVWIIHESYSAEAIDRLFPMFTRHRIEAAFAMAARVIPASHDTARLFDRLNTRGNVRVLHNGLDAAPFDAYTNAVPKADAARLAPGPAGKVRIISVGTVCERKGQHTLVEAAAELKRQRDDFVVQIIGLRDGVPYADHLRELVRRHDLGDCVQLVGETDGVWPYFRAADIFVCTSHIETFSRAVLEAEAFGLPILSTPVFGLSEQVFWEFNALQFGTGNATELAVQLGRLLDDPDRREAMGRRSRAAFDAHLSYDEMLDRYETVLLSAARTGPRGRTPHTTEPTTSPLWSRLPRILGLGKIG